MPEPAPEEVLVIRRALFDQLGSFHGFRSDADQYLPAILNPENNLFLPRPAAEEDPTHKQIIPYAIFQWGDRFLHYVRGSAGGERRLASKGSIGIGGHVNADDFHACGSLGRDLYLAGVEREINEELRIATGCRQSIIGLINDDTTEVGQVHLGIVHLFTLDAPDVFANEDGITSLEFLDLPALLRRAETLESWSRLLVEHLASSPLPAPEPASAF